MSGLVTTGTVNIVGTGGIIEGNLDDANVDVNTDAPYTFDGTDDFFHVAHHADFDATNIGATFTMSAWFYADSTMTGDNNCILAKNGTSGGDAVRPYVIFYSCSNKIIRCYIGDNSAATVFDSAVLTEDCWHHVAVTYNDSDDDIKMYIDGQTSGTGYTENLSYTRQLSTNAAGDKSLSIGGLYTNDTGSGTNFFKGYIADVRVYSDDLDNTEIPILASKINPDINLGAGSTNLVAHWPLLNGSPNDAENATKGDSSTDHDLTAVGSPAQDYDAFSVNVQDGLASAGGTTTDGTFEISQGKVEGLSLSSLDFEAGDTADFIETNDAVFNTIAAGSWAVSCWVTRESTGSQFIWAKVLASGWGNGGSLNFTGSNTLRVEISGEYLDSATAITTTGRWYHIVVARNANTGFKIWIDGVLDAEGMTGGSLGSGDTMSEATPFTIGRNGEYSSSYGWYDGKMRDVRIYDYLLSDDQAASLYSGSYNVTPKHWWKIDEGTGTAIEDYGTGTDYDGTAAGAAWDNGTLNLDGNSEYAHIVEDTGTLSAPRGTLDLGGDFRFEDGANFSHNSGLVWFTSSDPFLKMVHSGSGRKTPTNPLAFNNLKTSSSTYFNLEMDFTVEDTFTITNDTLYGVAFRQPVYLTMGTASSSGTIAGPTSGQGNFYFAGEATGSKVLAADTSGINPWIYTGNDWGWSSSAVTLLLENGDYRTALVTAEGYHNQTTSANMTIQLTGDMEFDAVTVSAGDTLDLNEQRVNFGGYNQVVNDGTIDATNALMYLGYFGGTGTFTNDANTKVVYQNCEGSRGSWRFAQNTSGVSMLNDGKNHDLAHDTTIGKLIVGETSATGFGLSTSGNEKDLTVTDLTIATGSKLVDDGLATGSVITCSGDFTTSGGLLGASCLNTDHQATRADGSDALRISGDRTIEFWMQHPTGNRPSAGNTLSLVSKDNYGYYVKLDENGKIKAGITSGSSTNVTSATVVDDAKWHHIAWVFDQSTADTGHKIYIDGKLDAQATSGGGSTGEAVALTIGTGKANSYMDEIRLWNDVRTETEIRDNMFTEITGAGNDAIAVYNCNEGTGTSSDDAIGSLDLTVNASGWAGAGNFDKGSSNLTMTGSNTYINYTGEEQVYDLTINGTVTLNEIAGNNDGFMPKGDFTVGASKTLSSTSTEGIVITDNSNTAITIGSPATSIAGLYKLRFRQSGSINLPACTTPRVFLETGTGNIVVATGNITVTQELEVASSGLTFNGQNHSHTIELIDSKGAIALNGATMTINNRVDADTTASWDLQNSTIQSAGTDHWWRVAHESNCELVGGTFKGFLVRNHGYGASGGSGITVIGSVINSSILGGQTHPNHLIQWHHTLDTQQLLDADSDGDDDLRLTKPALDNSHELMSG